MICDNCIHKPICHPSRVIGDLLDKVKDEMVGLVEGYEFFGYHIKQVKDRTLDRINSIDDSLKQFEENVKKICRHYKDIQ